MSLRLIIAEDSYLVREGTAALLRATDGVDVVATAVDLDSLLTAVESHQPDVVLTDIRMPPTHTQEGIDAAIRIRREHPEIGVIVLSTYLDSRYALDLLRDGVDGVGYLLKERVVHMDELVLALNQVANGGTVLDPKVVERMVRPEPVNSSIAGLTGRERETLELMAQGKSNAAIMDFLGLSRRTVEKHINSVFAKLKLSEAHDVNRRVRAVLEFLHAVREDSD